MGIKRVVDVSFWTDGKVDDFSPEDKYFMLYLLTNPFSKQLGIYEISIKQAAFQMGYSLDAFNVLLDRFENKYKIILFSKETSEIAILNFLRHSVMKGGKPVEDCIRKEMTLVKNKKLIDTVFHHLYGRDDLNDTVKKIVNAYINNNDNDNDNDNENENERTGGVSSHDSSPVSSTHTLFYNLISDYNISEPLKSKLVEWLNYKAERNESYTEQGLKAILQKVKTNCSIYGEKAVLDLIVDCMANGWKGIVFDRLKKQSSEGSASYDIGEYERKTIEEWDKKPEPKTAGEDETIRARAEELQRKLNT